MIRCIPPYYKLGTNVFYILNYTDNDYQLETIVDEVSKRTVIELYPVRGNLSSSELGFKISHRFRAADQQKTIEALTFHSRLRV